MTTKHISVSKLSEKQLCLLIAEEAGEIVQAATKILRFGLYSSDPNHLETNNYIDLMSEYRDLRELILELGNREGHNPEELRSTKERLVLS